MMHLHDAITPQRPSPLMRTLISLALGLLSIPQPTHAAPAYISGALGNFDAANFEGQDTYGFEVQLDGLQSTDLSQSWTGNKFGDPAVIPYATGVYVRYQSAQDIAGTFLAKTITKTPGSAFAGSCYMWSATYAQAGCDHFGIYINYTATNKPVAVTARWLLADPGNSSQLIGSANSVSVPSPTYYFQPPPVTQPTAAPVLVAEIQLPPPPAPLIPVPIPQYGNATWIKVFKTERNRDVALDELVAENPDGTLNPVVPQDVAQIETDWVLLQPSPPADGKRRQRGRHVNQGSPNSGSRAVIRRYETYAYTGTYDPLTHEAVCGSDGSCNAPLAGELGDMLLAQMAAANIVVPTLSVTTSGNGSVSATDKSINCGKTCSATYPDTANISLTANPASGVIFTGWTGCTNSTGLSCNVTVSNQQTVSATFKQQYSVSASTSNPGSVTATPNGNDRAINCGKDCAAKFTQGTIIAFTAIPATGKTFLGWSGDASSCTSAAICSLTVNSTLSVKASFSK